MCRRKEAHQSRDIARQMRFVSQRILLGLIHGQLRATVPCITVKPKALPNRQRICKESLERVNCTKASSSVPKSHFTLHL